MGDARTYMMQAIALAKRAEGRTAPNPMAGCVLVKDGRIVGRGWHSAAGAPHAESVAIADAGADASGAIAYVTLEPCSHVGRTGPCADALIEAGVAEVVYALADPNPAAAGGAARLRDADIKVSSGVCEAEARDLNRFWLHAIGAKRPYVVAKFAASLDGKIAARTGESKWITGPAARARAHALRRQVDAVIVGADTVAADDHGLTARIDGEETRGPLRIVLDSTARTSPGAKVYERSGDGALLVVTKAAPAKRLAAFREHGVEILAAPANRDGRPDVDALLTALGERGLNGVMIEGGGETLGSFFDAERVDEVWAFIAPLVIGGPGKGAVAGDGAATLAQAFRLGAVDIEPLGEDVLIRGRVVKNTEARRCSPA